MATLAKSARKIHQQTKSGRTTPINGLSTKSRGNGRSQTQATRPNMKRHLKGPS